MSHTETNVFTTADGQLVHTHEHLWNPTSIVMLLISGTCFSIYMWFYLIPLLRGQGPTSRHRLGVFVDTEMNAPQDVEKSSLISWIHRSSLGRFHDITGNLRPPFSRSSSSVPTLSPPPPAYPAGSDGSVEFELNRHPPSHGPAVRSNLDVHPRTLHVPRSQPPSPLQFSVERF